ncbi:hypothetical protein K8I61_02675 [bacterium]|nr:hypothetical protein [bacterium]
MRDARLFVLFVGLAAIVLLVASCGCGDDDDDDAGSPVDDDAADDDDSASGDDDADDDGNDDAVDDDDAGDDDVDDDAADDDTGDDDGQWEPSAVVPIDVYGTPRGYTVARGMIHIHNVYSHDGCDNRPLPGGVPNAKCLAQFREAICLTNQQFIMLTDHGTHFGEFDFPAVLLHDEAAGDTLLYDGDDPIANVVHCADGNDVTLMAGSENKLMPIHFRRMPDGTVAERKAFLGRSDAPVVAEMEALGAAVFIAHPEGWTTEEIRAVPVTGWEFYNLHANIDPGIRADDLGLPALSFILDLFKFIFPFEEAGHSDLMLLTFLSENGPGLDHMDRILAERRVVGTMGTDAHRNALPFPLLDGDRADSYRRMMRWFANYALIDEATPEGYIDAIDNGRMYGAFQVFGEPVGFDFRADHDGGVAEMGETVDLADAPTLVVEVPTFFDMPSGLPAPDFRTRIIMADSDGGIVVAETTTGDELTYDVLAPGAYRAEVYVTPHHLEPWLGADAADFIHEYPLIYGNAIYVTD